ncbi:MAG: DUF2889 domain-containing protein [Anaerovoracaceae bacterium]|jgi:hypothetical protein|nr:DUF2889 domain-containing protein [Anaerovoracaceae bacterium]
MYLIDECSYSCTVDNQHNSTIVSKVSYLDKEKEITVSLLVDINTFHVIDSWYEVFRNPDKSLLGFHEIEKLKGYEAYLNAGKVIRTIEEPNHNSNLKELVRECVRGVIQAENNLYRHRGFSNAKDYFESWNVKNKDNCYRFSNLDKEIKETKQKDYILELSYLRKNNLFNCHQNYKLLEIEKILYAIGVFSDSFHNYNLTISYKRETGDITGCFGDMRIAPNDICRKGITNLDKFIGMNIERINYEEINKIVGGSFGCVHFENLSRKLINTIKRNHNFEHMEKLDDV